MKFTLAFIFLFLRSFLGNAQDDDYVNDKQLRYSDYVYTSNIKTIQFHELTWEYAPPILDFNSGRQLELSFDDIEGDQKQYSIGFVHCNADWTPSDLMISEYLNGFFDLNILNFSFSENTLQKYTHYNIVFPNNNNIQFTKSGNYIMYVYKNGDKKDLVLSRRFMLVEDAVTITTAFSQTPGGEGQFNKQHLDFKIINSAYDITNPYVDLKVVITQNNRWDNAVTNIKPTFIAPMQLTYSLDEASTFNGGNEFRFFDVRTLRGYTERIRDIYRDEDGKNHVQLLADESRSNKNYIFYNDFNGNFLIKNRDMRGNPDTEADYVWVEFFLPYPNAEADGNFYVLGKLTDWMLTKNSKMNYNTRRQGYECKLYVKQGFYNYTYVLKKDNGKGGDETITEGNHWDTENDYTIFVYHRQRGQYYDKLIAVRTINSLKR
jgi:hypothetical protein